jgi:hypothetical protein
LIERVRVATSNIEIIIIYLYILLIFPLAFVLIGLRIQLLNIKRQMFLLKPLGVPPKGGRVSIKTFVFLY